MLDSCKGFVLVELMMVMVTGIVLLGIVFEVYLGCERSLALQAALMTIQDNAETAISILHSEIDRAGYIGCSLLTNDFPIADSTDYSLSAVNRLTGTDSNQITVRYQAFPGAELLASMQGNTSMIVNNQVQFSEGDILLISDCSRAEIFQVAKVSRQHHVQTIMPRVPLHYRYAANAELDRLEINRYFVANTGRTDRDGSPMYSLYREDIHHVKSELVEGVSDMRILYSVYKAGAYTDVPAASVTDWSQVKGVSIDLLVSGTQSKKTWHMYAIPQVH